MKPINQQYEEEFLPNVPLTLDDGIQIAREMEQILIPLGYHCGLIGSLLHKGTSTKDADIVIYPHQVSEQLSVAVLMDALGVFTASVTNEASCKDKMIAVCDYKGQRVDLFFLK